MKTFAELFVANVKELVRDRMAIFWFLVFPVIFILIFGAVFANEGSSSFDVGLVAESQDPVAEQISRALGSIASFKIHQGTRDQELNALTKGDRRAVIVIPEEVGPAVTSGQPAQIPVYYDASQQASGQVLVPVIAQVLDGIERGITHRPQIFRVQPQAVQPKELRTIDYLLPGILAMALMQLGIFGALHLVSLREQKILKSLGTTPLPRWTLLGAEISVRFLMALVQTLTIVVIGYLVFHVTVIGSWLKVLGIVVLGAATFVSLGYLLVSLCKTEESAVGLANVVQFPMMFLSGIFFPVEFMPAFLKPVLKAMPLTYLGDALRQVMVEATPLYSLPTDLLVLVAWAVATLVVAVRFWKWE